MEEIKDIAQWEETDSELAKYTIGKLQEENEQLKKCNKESVTFLNQDDIRDYIMQKDYEIYKLQQRIDKAIEYIKDNACYEEDTKIFCDDLRYDECLKLLNILRGEDSVKD